MQVLCVCYRKELLINMVFYLTIVSQVALGASLGISEPQLMKMMRATLFTHTQWFKVQMCTDRFADLLSINALKEPDAMAETSEPPVEDSKAVGGSASCTSTSEISGSQLPDVPRDGPVFDDGSVLTLMVYSHSSHSYRSSSSIETFLFN